MRGCKGLLTVAAVLILGLVSADGALAWRQKPKHKKPNHSVHFFKKELGRMGFMVQEGIVDFPNLVDMCCRCRIFSCFANNPSSPYGLFVLPPAPNQKILNPFAEWFTKNQDSNSPWYDPEQMPYPENGSWFWRLRPDEAMVFLGTTPPHMTYFGFTGYLYDRYHDGMPDLEDCITAENDYRPMPESAANRLPLFASLGDTVNNRTIHVEGSKRHPFDKDVVLIAVADRKVEQRIRKALWIAGYQDSMINTVVVSQDLVRLGVDFESDSLLFVLRMATKTNPALERYMASPGTLLRVSPYRPIPPHRLDPLSTPKLRVRGTGRTETDLLPLVDQLGQAIVNAYPGYEAKPIATANWYEGYNCIENSMNCLGDNRDTPYILPGFNPLTRIPYQDLTIDVDDGKFFVVYGVNHQATGKAIYSNVAILGWEKKCSPIVIDNDEMPGSANVYLGLGPYDSAANKLYAYVIARPGGCDALPSEYQDYCLEVGYDCASGVPATEPLTVVFRAYLETRTNVGAAYPEIVIDRIIRFTPN